MKNNFNQIEKKWQQKWEEKKIFQVKEGKKKKYYVLEMFPYPSGEGLHMGHSLNYTIGDIHARLRRMQGLNVLYPMGYDSFGLPAENAAIQAGKHPKTYTEKAIKSFIKQQKLLGLSYDWSRLIKTSDSEYYKWNQLFFLKFLEKGLVYRKKAPVNWCRKCKTVLANEQVHNGKCWRHEDTDIETKHLEQWFIKITDYAEELLEDMGKLDWPERIKIMQRNWIGKSEGTEIFFEVENPDNKISNVVIVHGCPSNAERAMDEKTRTYDKHWIPWLKKRLEEKEIKVLTPLMPTPWEPKYEEWKEIFDKLPVNENSVLIGHSCGGAFLVRWLGEAGKKIKSLILVSPGKARKESRKTFPNLYGDKTYKNIQNYVKEEIVVFTSNDDINIHIKNAYEYEKELPAKVINFKGKGHFTEGDMGTKEFPELLEEIFPKEKWSIFTTRPDTIYGVTFMVVSAQHQKLMDLVTKEQKKEMQKFLKKIKTTKQRNLDKLDKEGVFTGSYAVNPINNEKVPVYAGNFVVAEYGSGMVMGVPAHDQRDFEFAKKYNLPIRVVIQPKTKKIRTKEMKRAYDENGFLVNSNRFNGIENHKAKWNITQFLGGEGLGKKSVQYKLKDWLISRQRYWGTPIPVVYCESCGIVPLKEKDLPIKLPEKVKFGKGNPLTSNKSFLNVKCPKCKDKAKRETDTMDTFFDSSWYFLRFCDAKNNKNAFDKNKVKYWMPVDQYIGGEEHACMHLIYARFFTKALRDLSFFGKKIDEPFTKLFNQGMLHGSDGNKMSKSRGNIINPVNVIEKHGADSLRIALMSFASPDKDTNWDEKVLIGSEKFLKKIFNYFGNVKIVKKQNAKIESKLNKTIKEVTNQIESFKYNLAIIEIRNLFNSFSQENTEEILKNFLKLLHPFCPHVTEELWENLHGNRGSNFISLEKWPKADESKIDEKFDKQDELIRNIARDIINISELIGKDNPKAHIYPIPSEMPIIKQNEEAISMISGAQVITHEIHKSEVYDPENKSKKAKPGKPGIYLE